jgi:serine/threonine protein kinase
MDTGGITRENLPRKLTLEFIKKITGKLSQPQPIGGVYEVNLDDDSKITVKKLAENAPVPRDIVFDKIIDLKHENIVKMIAYCPKAETRLEQSNERSTMADVTENILCYEYLPADNLEDILRGGSSILKHWDMRFKIIKGICKGIYCIQNLETPIVHLDLKPQNILLDKNMVPKISNFGFAKMFEQNETKMKATNAMGSV